MTDTNKVDVGPFSDEPVMYGTPWGDLVPASALAALRQEIIAKNAPEIEKVNAHIKQVEAERYTLRTQLAEAQAEAEMWKATAKATVCMHCDAENKRLQTQLTEAQAKLEDTTSEYNRCVEDVHAARAEALEYQQAADKMAMDHKIERDGLRTQLQAEQAKVRELVEPVAWMVHPFDYGIGHEGVYALTTRTEQVMLWKHKGWDVQPLYPASAIAALQTENEKLKEGLDKRWYKMDFDAVKATTDRIVAERDTLRTQLAEAQAELAEWQHTNRIDALYRQLEAAQADAARYRWLRDMDEQPVYSLAAIFTDCQGSAESISQRIDYAVDTLMRMPK
jgi:chromosome segregation ATPase